MSNSVRNMKILVVDDDELVVSSIDLMFKTAGFNNIIKCTDSRLVSRILDEEKISCMILDLSMPHKNGNEVLADTVLAHPEIPVVILTSTIDVGAAVHCMKEGAADYLPKPVEKEKLIATVGNIVKLKDLELENEILKTKLLAGSDSEPESVFFSSIVTRDSKMKAIFHYIESVATSVHPFLISGETGTGKELFAKAIHDASGRTGKFVPVNMAGLDDTVFTDALFGHKKGAYTSADGARSGLIKEAEGGTIFLDEIGDLSQASQMKLLRLLQSGEYYPLGSDICIRSNARVVAATNKDIEKAVQSGDFRRDLYYRLYTHRIVIPSLRERRGDIPLLLDHFIDKASEQSGKPVPSYSEDLVSLLIQYDYPGNVRELESMVSDVIAWNRRDSISASQFIERSGASLVDLNANVKSAVLPESILMSGGKFPTIREMEMLLIKQALACTENNQVKAAALLGITRQTLSTRLKEIESFS